METSDEMQPERLRARRIALGLSEAWACDLLDDTHVMGGGPTGHRNGNGSTRLHVVEHGGWGPYSEDTAYAYRAAYHAALCALEAKREPVPPAGVRKDVCAADGDWIVILEGAVYNAVWVKPDGGMTTSAAEAPVTPALLEYAAALSRYRATKHAAKATERQRLLDAREAAQDALNVARDARDRANRGVTDACAKETEAACALDAARAACREAGL